MIWQSPLILTDAMDKVLDDGVGDFVAQRHIVLEYRLHCLGFQQLGREK